MSCLIKKAAAESVALLSPTSSEDELHENTVRAFDRILDSSGRLRLRSERLVGSMQSQRRVVTTRLRFRIERLAPLKIEEFITQTYTNS